MLSVVVSYVVYWCWCRSVKVFVVSVVLLKLLLRNFVMI